MPATTATQRNGTGTVEEASQRLAKMDLTATRDQAAVKPKSSRQPKAQDREPNAEAGETTPPAAEEQEVGEKTPPPTDEQEAATEEEPEGAGKEKAPRVYKVKVEGTEYEVPEEELIRGYQRQQDYTRKTMELAEARKAAQAEAESFQQLTKSYQDALATWQGYLQTLVGVPKAEELKRLMEEDPTEYLRQRAKLEELHSTLAQIEAERNRLKSQEEAQLRARREEYLAQQARLLSQLIPDWATDQKKMQEESAAVQEYLIKEFNVHPKAVEELDDALTWRLAYDSMKYRQGLKRAAEKKKETGASPHLTPGAKAEGPDKRAALQAGKKVLRETGRLSDAAAALKHMFPEE